MKKLLPLAAAVLFCAAAVSPAAAKAKRAKAPKAAAGTLAPGHYTAQVKLLACEACGPEVEKTLKGIKGIENPAVDSKTSTVAFDVKSPVKVAEIRKKLKAAQDDMGMGDYTLSKIQSLKSAGKPQAPKSEVPKN